MLPLKNIPDQKNVCPKPDLPHICTTVAKYYKVSTESLHIVNYTSVNIPRKIAIYLAAELTGLKFKFIADFFKNISADGISQIVRRINKLKTNTLSISNDIANLGNIIQK